MKGPGNQENYNTIRAILKIIVKMNFIRFMLILTFSFEADSLRSVTGWSSLKLLRKVNPSISTRSNWPEGIKKRHIQPLAFKSEFFNHIIFIFIRSSM